MRLLLLLAEQSEKRGLGDAHHLETDSRNITHSVTRTTETSNEHLVVLVHVVQATIAGNEGSDLLAVLDELHTHALTNGRVGLLGFHATCSYKTDEKHLHLLEDNALSHGSATEDVRLNGRNVVTLLVLL